jgi:hypothetical protein
MALTLTEKAVMPATGGKRMAIWLVTGDGSSYQITVKKLKMEKVEAAWTANVDAPYHLTCFTDNYDYTAGPVDYLELGDDGGNVLENGKKHLLFVVGY